MAGDEDRPFSGPGLIQSPIQGEPGGAASGAAEFGNLFTPPSISLPKGGGAISGIGEKFSVNPATGTGSLSVPVFASPGRSGFGPQLRLSYDSGNGNGPFGFGWNLSIPTITRKTDKGLPRYHDAEESDVFLLSGAEDLVPVLDEEGGRHSVQRAMHGCLYNVQRYRPRTEGLFARIERWQNNQSGETHWRSISRDNVVSLYGQTKQSRIVDPEDPSRIFSWLLDQTYDDKGNVVVYEYAAEDRAHVPPALHEKHRTVGANRYPKRIRYGNRAPYFPTHAEWGSAVSLPDEWHFTVVFDYGDHDFECPELEADRQWPSRPDAFSSYRSSFEVRTYRLCRRVLMFHHFAELGDRPCLVRSTDFTYSTDTEPEDPHNPIYTFLEAVTQAGYVRQEDGSYYRTSMPPLEFAYSRVRLDGTLHTLRGEAAEDLPPDVDGRGYRWIDLDSEGLPGILSEQAGALFYRRNVSGLPVDSDRLEAHFEPAELVGVKPTTMNLRGGQQLLDLSGEGRLSLVQLGGPMAGYCERLPERGWAAFVPFRSTPAVAPDDPNLRLVDLDGDGRADILITEDDVFTWYRSWAKRGFGPAETAPKALDEERGPAVVFADPEQSIYLADLSGDGLSDLVRIRNGEVCYWPNLGYGRFGAKITMDRSPWFDWPDRFDQRRLRLADIDGSGTTDIIYLGSEEITCWFNQAGNGWSGPHELGFSVSSDELPSVSVLDLLGNGTACLVWSSPLSADAGRPMRYVELMGGQKPHLLVSLKNNLGAETRISYAPSTSFYLADRAAGKPWVTRLPFPVHVVERVETFDWISRNRFVTRYAYHHGYFDGVEREFRGFGLVEQWDTEQMEALSGSRVFPTGENIDAASHMPPVLTKTWFHTGVYLDERRVIRQYAHEYWHEPDLTESQLRAMQLEDAELPSGLNDDEQREAYRALKGSILRQEIYAEDGTERSGLPYSVSERSYTIRLVQRRGPNRHAVLFVHPRETLSFHFERALYEVEGHDRADPRVAHNMALAVDDYGHILQSVAVGYGRRFADPDRSMTGRDRERQEGSLLMYTENRYSNPVLQDDVYRAPMPSEVRTYEILQAQPDAHAPLITNLFGFGETQRVIRAAADGLHDLAYDDVAGVGATEDHPYRRPIGHTRTLYRRNDLSGALPLMHVESLALPYQTYKLVFTPGLIKKVYGDRVTDGMLREEGRYFRFDREPGWWIPSGRVFYSPAATDGPDEELAFARRNFFLGRRFEDPFGVASTVRHDRYNLLPLESEDALHNKITAGERMADGHISNRNDYRVLRPSLITDSNGNRSAAAFDALGMVVGTAVMGKRDEHAGDTLEGFIADLDEATALAHFAHPLSDPNALLQGATTRLVRDLFAYHRTRAEPHPQPATVYALARETHHADLAEGEETRIQQSFTYSDGYGREVQRKLQAERGPLSGGGEPVSPRWVGSGWTIFNNKGKPVRKYEPFFSAKHRFEFAQRAGVSPILLYDPIGRVVATLYPNHTYEKVVFDPWRQAVWDANDTVLQTDPGDDRDVGAYFRRLSEVEYLPTWYTARIDGGKGPQQRSAARKAAAHAGTPSVAHLDAMGRTILTIADNGPDGKYVTRFNLDITGNPLAVTDARGNVAVANHFDMMNHAVGSSSPDSGERRTLNNVADHPVRRWDARGQEIRVLYDELQRPTHLFVRPAGDAEILAERTIFGEAAPNPEATNHRGKPYQQYDGAGLVWHAEYDFKGNLLQSTRRLARTYEHTPDWSAAARLTDPQTIADGTEPLLEEEAFTARSRYDALNRPIGDTTPDASETRSAYNEAGLLDSIEARLRGVRDWKSFVTTVDYDARGQRQLIQYGNTTRSRYEYDNETERLVGLATVRGHTALQDLHYAYDPVGNLVEIDDDAQRTVYFDNTEVSPNGEYEYDAVYRLRRARGREWAAGDVTGGSDWSDCGIVISPHPNDVQAVRPYTERYSYDEVGNISRMEHVGRWTRQYRYERGGNQLLSTSTPGDPKEGPYSATYGYDAHGNMIRMPGLERIQWDHKDQIQAADLGGGGTVYYTYDALGQRVRKVVVSGSLVKEHIYLGGYEIFRQRSGARLQRERQTLCITDANQRVAVIDTVTVDDGTPVESPSPITRFQLENHLGSACLELDDSGAVLSYEEYYPYGTTSYRAGRSAAEASLKRYRYVGKERDEETSLYYYGARYYAPWLGRWTSCDPKGMVDGPGPYTYTRNNPIILNDPSGMQSAPNELPSQGLDILSHTGVSTDRGGDDSGGGSFWSGIGDALGSVWNGITGAVNAAWNWTTGAASTAWSWLTGAATTAWNWTTSAIGAAWDWTKGAVSAAWNWTMGAGSTAWNWIKGAATSAWNWTTGALSAAWDWTTGALSAAWDWTKGAASTAWDWGKRAASWTWNWVLAPSIRTATNALAGAIIGGIPGAIVGAVAGAVHGWRMADAHSYDWGSLAGWAMFLADNTWSLPNSVLGSLWASVNIANPTAEDLSKDTGQLVFEHGLSNDYATTFGNVTAGRNVPGHERVHALQARLFGPLLYPTWLVHYAINTLVPYWLAYHGSKYPRSPITTFGEYFTRGVYPHTWPEEWAYAIEGSPP